MELDDLALPMANRWTPEQMQEQIDMAKHQLNNQVRYTFGSGEVSAEGSGAPADAGLMMMGGGGARTSNKLALPPRIKTFLLDVRNSGTLDGGEIGQFIGFSHTILASLTPVVEGLTGCSASSSTDAAEGQAARPKGDADEASRDLMEAFKELVAESDALRTICASKVAMAEGDDLTADFTSRERVEAHRAAVMDFLRRQLPIGIRPPLNKLPPFMSRKLTPDSEAFQW